MRRLDEDALVCDLAEVYQVYDLRQLPLRQVAVLAYGLPDSSRIKRRFAGQKVPLETLLLAGVYDQLNALVFGLSGKKDQPASISALLTDRQESAHDESSQAFHSKEDFEHRRQALLEYLRKEDADGDTIG